MNTIYPLIEAGNTTPKKLSQEQMITLAEELNHLKYDTNQSMGAVGKIMRAIADGESLELDDELMRQLGFLFSMLSDIVFLCDDHEFSFLSRLNELTNIVGGDV